MLRQWRASGVPVPLTLLSAPYRDIASVILQYVRSRRRAIPTEMLVVYMPQFLVTHWWENLVHNQSGLRLRAALLDVPGVVITIVPWQLGEDDVVEGASALTIRSCAWEPRPRLSRMFMLMSSPLMRIAPLRRPHESPSVTSPLFSASSPHKHAAPRGDR